MAKQKIVTASPLPSVTLSDVAAHAGVSVMTASRAISGERNVAESYKKRVFASVEALGYIPNLSARLMRGRGSKMLGVVVNDLNMPDTYTFVSKLINVARDYGREVLIYNLPDLSFPESGAGINLLSGVCDGLLILQRIPDGMLGVLEKSKTPVVLANYSRTSTSLPVVRADNFLCSRDAVRHLLEQGHERIGFVGGTPHSGQSAERKRGYLAALEERGIAPMRQWIESGDFSQASGLEAGRRLLRRKNRPSAIFAANDSMAFGVMEAARDLNFTLPDDLSVVGFDDTPAAAQSEPPLTTIRQPLQRLVEAAMSELLARIDKSADQHACIELPCELVIRASTLAPPELRTGATRKPRAARAKAT